MADFEAPSFSLGLDLDFDAPCNPPPDSSTNGSFVDAEVVDSDPDLGPEPPRILKRLRRGTGTIGSSSASAVDRVSEDFRCNGPNGEEDIEDFSSQEGIIEDEQPSRQYNSVCSSSKAPWHQRGVLMTKSSNVSKATKEKQASHASSSARIETRNNTSIFPKFTSSPLRRFQLIDSDSDSDSDDPCVDVDMKGKAHSVDVSLKARQSNSGHCATLMEQTRANASVSMPQEDLWKDLCPMSSRIPTPAFDEVCEEYFHSTKDKKVNQKLGGVILPNFSSQIDEHQRDTTDPLPPAHRYFFHDDPRIQQLVRSRLPNFFPLGIVNSEVNRQPGASVIDYMSQFSHGESSKKPATRNINPGGSSTRGRKKSKDSDAKEVSQGWTNPKHNASNPKDAGKRRVQADGQSSGHWYSRADGTRVYVTKNGQELTGRIAYQHYKRESKTGFKKSKKKANTKKRKR